MPRKGIIAVTGVGMASAVAAYAFGGQGTAPDIIQVKASNCNSCDARKQDLSRLRKALNTFAKETE